MSSTEYTTVSDSSIDSVAPIVKGILETARGRTVPVTFVCEFEERAVTVERVESVLEQYSGSQFVSLFRLSSVSPYYKVFWVVGSGNESMTITGEVCSDWMRLYVDGSEDVDMLVSSVVFLIDELPCVITVGSDYV